ncbi:hypothetical protein [Burkholderia sp. Ac-20365]|uniref:hypothetical protein n=1 Tax=Burkholderia sp. Ac-20365 TaxID=2703897 RepID=UPI00197B62EB|nr:hypothetical protein [Burkholderia sp. Ac-20365]MBN3760977.1 hypothetical protein [Burkholderia sp. Ac-20365]
MKPLGLYLKGFSGITYGLHKDEITLDLTAIPETATLIALSAPNGKGKSTILDNLHPYRIMPGRARGKATPTAFSYWNELASPVAEKRFDWEHEGAVYRTHLLFKSTGKSQSQSAYLLERRGLNWEPVSMPDGTKSDGSVASYDRCLEAILGKCPVFVTTAFAASKRTMLAAYDTSDIKKLLSIWLDVERLIKMSDDAAKVSALLQVKLDEMHTQLRDEQSIRDAVRVANELRARLTGQIEAQNIALHSAETVAEDARQSVVRLDAQVEGMRQIEVQRADLRRQINEERSRAEDLAGSIRKQANAALELHRQQERDLTQNLTATAQDIRQIRVQLETVEARIGEEAGVIAAATKLAEVQKCQTDITSQLEVIARKVAELKPHRVIVVQQTELQANAFTNGSATRQRIEQIENTAALAGKVPCVATDLQSRCELLNDALAAKAQLQSVTTELFRLRKEYRSAGELLKRAGVEVAKLDELETQESRLRAELGELATQATALAATAARAQSIAEARQQLPVLRSTLSQKEQHLAEVEGRRAANARASQALDAEVEAKVGECRKASGLAVQVLEQRLAGLPAEIAAQVRADALAARNNAEQAVAVAKQKLAESRGQLTDAERQLAQVQVKLEQLEPVRCMADTLSIEIAHWKQTSSAAGKDGLVAFEIDDAGPEISAYANELLKQCYDGQFVVRFATQHELRSGEVREGFDIKVRDTQGGPEKSIDDLSGGQEVFVNECVTRAVALYLAESGRYRYDTLFTDEADGPLDEDKKRKFIAMKRKVLEIGRYSREYFVTQTKELQGMADYVIDVAAL